MNDSDDPLIEQLLNLKSNLPKPRRCLSEDEKDKLIKAIGGPKTAESIIKAQKELPLDRIPFIFNRLDTQLVVDILANDMKQAIIRAKKR